MTRPAAASGRLRGRLRGAAVHRTVGPALATAGALTACVTVTLVDPNEPGRYPTCPFLALTGLQCPGCGTLRALHALLGGDLLRAMGHNLLSVVVLPVLAWALVEWWRHVLGRRPSMPSLTTPAAAGLALLLPLFWVLRNVPVEPLVWLAP